MIEINCVHNMDCLEGMKLLPDACIDLTVTSPPYDDLRDYNGYLFDFEGIARELYRVTKDGGVIVWVVNDKTVKGSETGTSFKQALFFKTLGFSLHDTMIYAKSKIVPTDFKCNRYYQGFEYMFVFSKGKPKTCNYIRVPSKHGGKKAISINRKEDGSLRDDRIAKQKGRTVAETKIKSNIWEYASQSVKGHPAPFPEKLAEDHILSWSNEDDVILDPFSGSGTTLKMAKLNNRNFLGFEISEEYCEIIAQRV
jgi:DNA modification methylase